MEEYDYVILGTGLVETICSLRLAKQGKKVLVLDRNSTYGDEIRTLNYIDFCKHFNLTPIEKLIKLDKQFNIDLIPKIIVANGKIQTYINDYNIKEMTNFVLIPGSYIYKNNKKYKIPTTEMEAFSSSLISFFQKPKLMKFFWDLKNYVKDSENYKFRASMEEEFYKYGLDKDIQELIGHAIALNLDNKYLKQPPRKTFDQVVLYIKSIIKYQGDSSPYIFPQYGLSELSQSISFFSGSYNTVFRLNTNVKSIKNDCGIYSVELIDHNNKNLEVYSNCIIGNNSYFPEKRQHKYDVIRSICIIEGETKILKKNISAQITFLSSEINRKNDVFLLILTEKEKVCPENYTIAIISTIRETSIPENEIMFLYDHLGNVIHKTLTVEPIYTAYNTDDKTFIIDSVDHTPSIESLFTEADEILNKIEANKYL